MALVQVPVWALRDRDLIVVKGDHYRVQSRQQATDGTASTVVRTMDRNDVLHIFTFRNDEYVALVTGADHTDRRAWARRKDGWR